MSYFSDNSNKNTLFGSKGRVQESDFTPGSNMLISAIKSNCVMTTYTWKHHKEQVQNRRGKYSEL